MFRHVVSMFLIASFISILSLNSLSVYAQTPNSNSIKKGETSIHIYITFIEYDNSAFTIMRESLKSNKKVRQFSPSYTLMKAEMKFIYMGNGIDCWDELPAAAKKGLKLISIDDTLISLMNDKEADPDTKKAIATTVVKKTECLNCVYYNACNLDTSIVFNGSTYLGKKGVNLFYRCNNGVLSRIFTDTDNKMKTQTIFKANEPVGTKWQDSSTSGIGSHVLMAKGISLKINSKSYNDMLLVYHDYKSIIVCDYYARDSGSIKRDTLNAKFNPVNAAKLKGSVDQSIVGTWKFYSASMDMNMYFVFKGDGTYSYYVGSINADNQSPKGKCYWRLNNNSMEIFHSAWDEVIKLRFQKKNDLVTSRPALFIQQTDTEDRMYISDDGRELWK